MLLIPELGTIDHFTVVNVRLRLTLFRYKPLFFSYGNFAEEIIVSITTT